MDFKKPRARPGGWVGVGVFASVVCLLSGIARAELTIGAAISMGHALEEIVRAYPGEKPRLNLSGTNVIARQIEAGAPMDVFISADRATLMALEKSKLTSPSSLRTIATNEMVVVLPLASKISVKAAADLLVLERLAIADASSVPAGIYAKKWLTEEGLWMQLEGKIIPLQNVRAALIAAETANADAAIVYRSDAASSRKVKIAFTAPAEKTGAIEYPAAIVSASKKQKEATRFIEFLTSEAATAILVKHGFGTP